MKRKRGSTLPERIAVEPAGEGQNPAGPFAAFFANGFQPGRNMDCAWEVHANGQRQLLVARTARIGLDATLSLAVLFCWVQAGLTEGKFVAQHGVDFVGDSSWPATLGPPTCRHVPILRSFYNLVSWPQTACLPWCR